MKLCATCQRCFEDDKAFCPRDGATLSFVRPGTCLIAEKYLLHRRIGRGGMGTVYAGTHQDLERKVAVKLLSSEFMSDPHALERFRREARAAARINHQNVADLFDYGSLPDGSAYIVMELVEGVTVRKFIDERTPIDIAAVLEIVRQSALGVAAAHRQNIVHRDLKPSNIILTGDHHDPLLAKVLDFGIAKLREQTSGLTLTQHDGIVGTPRYMSPEQCAGTEADFRSDIYSLGVILYELLARRVPFDAPTPTAIALKHLHEPPPPLDNTTVSIPDSIRRLVMQSLDKNPAARPPSAAAFADQLFQLRAEVPAISSDTLAYLERRTEESEEEMARGNTDTGETNYQTLKHDAVTHAGHHDTNAIAAPLPEPPSPSAASTTLNVPAASHTAVNPSVMRTSRTVIATDAPSLDGNLATARSPLADDSSATLALIHTEDKRRAPHLLIGALALATLVISGLAAFWFAAQRNQPTASERTAANRSVTATDRTTQPAVKPAQSNGNITSSPTPQLFANSDQEAVRLALNDWVTANNSRQVDAQIKFYADPVERYYLQRNVPRSAVRADKARVFNSADSAQITIGGVSIVLDKTNTNATVRFYKKYAIDNSRSSRQGTVLQEMQWTKTNEGWRITAERDIRVLS